MAIRKPLVIINGQRQELPAGDTLGSASSEVDVVSLTAAATLVALAPVYVSAANACDKASAAAAATAKILGFAQDAIAASAAGLIQTDGILSGTTVEWDAVAGTTGGLAAGTTYFLSSTAGLITSTAPTASGSYVVKVGTALSTTELEISISDSTLLA